MPAALLVLLVAGPPAGWPGFGGPAGDFRTGPLPAGDPAVLWRRPLGPGDSGIVTDGSTLFTLYAIPDPANKRRGAEVVVAVDAATGKTRWEHKYPVAMRPEQETVRGAAFGPQATPLLHAGRLVTVGFAGRLHALDPATGKVLWAHDLVADFAADPMQYGLAASPVGCRELVLVHAGGRRTAVIAFAAADGTVRWLSEPARPSYATPVLVRVAGEEQVVQVTRDRVYGFAAADGGTRWRYDFPAPGFDNAPTPLPLPGDRLLLSDRGVMGTRLLKLTRDSAAEVWAVRRPRFCHFNWVAAGDVVYGHSVEGLVALRLADGETLWTAGGAGGTLVGVGGEFLRLRETGQLDRLTLTPDAAGPARPVATVAGRCWTPPTVAGRRAFVRSNQELVAVGW